MKAPFVKILSLFLLVVLSACEVKIPDGVIVPDKMADLLYDYHLAQAVTAEENPLSYKKKLHINYVFAKHGLTKEEFDSSLVWYTRYPKQLAKVYAGLEKVVLAEMEEMGVGTVADDAFNTLMATADTVNLWREARVKLLSSTAMANRILFEYKADTTYVKGDSISFSFVARHLSAGKDSVDYDAQAALVVEYGDATSSVAGVRVTADGNYAVAVERNFGSEIKSLRGFLYYSDNDSLAAPKLLVCDIAVKRIHPLPEK